MTSERSDTKTRLSRNYKLQLATVFIGFLVFGFSENIKGPAIPRIQLSFGIDEMQLGTLLSLNALGYLLACTFTAFLVRKFGIKRVTLLAFGSMALSGVFIFLSHHYSAFTVSYFLMYIGNGILEIALALLAARIFVRNTGTMMNLSHFFYGLSSTVAPMIASGLMTVTVLGYELDWRGMYMLILALSAIPMIPALFASFPNDELEEHERMAWSSLMRDRTVWLLVLILTFGVVSELAVGGWLVNYLEKAYGWTSSAASGMLSAFFLCFTFARLFLGPVTDRIGFTVSLIVFSGFSGLCTIAAIAAGQSGALLFAIAGIGIAPVYPTIMAFIAKKYRRQSDTVITFTVTLMGIGNVVGNYMIGAITQSFKTVDAAGADAGLMRGLQAGYSFIALCALLCSAAGIVLYRHLKKRNELL